MLVACIRMRAFLFLLFWQFVKTLVIMVAVNDLLFDHKIILYPNLGTK